MTLYKNPNITTKYYCSSILPDKGLVYKQHFLC